MVSARAPSPSRQRALLGGGASADRWPAAGRGLNSRTVGECCPPPLGSQGLLGDGALPDRSHPLGLQWASYQGEGELTQCLAPLPHPCSCRMGWGSLNCGRPACPGTCPPGAWLGGLLLPTGGSAGTMLAAEAAPLTLLPLVLAGEVPDQEDPSCQRGGGEDAGRDPAAAQCEGARAGDRCSWRVGAVSRFALEPGSDCPLFACRPQCQWT